MFRVVFVLLSFAAWSVRAEPLSLEAALAMAERSAPDTEVEIASVEEATAAAMAAGRLPDPKLAIGLENVPVEGADRWSLDRDFMTMRKIGVMQEVPNRAKRRAESDIARAAVTKAQLGRRTRLLTIRRDAAVAWLTRYFAERQVDLFEELERENRLFAEAVRARLRSGKGSAADVILPQQEAAAIADRRDDLASEIARAKSGLQRWIGTAADAPLANELPPLVLDSQRLRAHVHEHPELSVFAPMTAMAQAEVHAAEAAKKPDWGVELAYGNRADLFGDMVSVEFTVGLPLFSRTRQDPQIAAKRQALRRVEAERLAMLRDHEQELENDLAQYEALSRRLERMQSTHLPLATQKVDYQLTRYRAGTGDLAAVLSARSELIDLRIAALQLQAEHAKAAARIYYIYGEGAR